MPITKDSLKTRIVSKMTAAFGTPDDSDTLEDWADVIADAVVEELKTNGTVTVASVTGVTSGAQVSGPGVGTID